VGGVRVRKCTDPHTARTVSAHKPSPGLGLAGIRAAHAGTDFGDLPRGEACGARIDFDPGLAWRIAMANLPGVWQRDGCESSVQIGVDAPPSPRR
jgi:hypothetical protein